MIIIDIIKRIHHKTKRKCRRYHEIIINDDQKEVIKNIMVGVQFNGGDFRIDFLQIPRTFQLHPIYMLITFYVGFILFVAIIFLPYNNIRYSYYF
jgi:hypothetical protein